MTLALAEIIEPATAETVGPSGRSSSGTKRWTCSPFSGQKTMSEHADLAWRWTAAPGHKTTSARVHLAAVHGAELNLTRRLRHADLPLVSVVRNTVVV